MEFLRSLLLLLLHLLTAWKRLPAEVNKFDKKSAHVFSSLLKGESYPHYESRLMLAGEQGTGKTTLARYLVGKQPTRLRISTDGIELYNGLSFMDRESKEWHGGHQDFSLEEITVSRSLLKEKKLSKSVKLDDSTPSSQDVPVEAQIKSIPGSKRNLQHKPNDTLSSDTPSEWPEHEANTGYGTGIQDKFPSSDMQLSSMITNRTSSYESRNRNELLQPDFLSEKENTDSMDDNSGGCRPESGVTGEMHIETVTKPGVIRRLKNFFGVAKKVKEIKVSITKEKFLEKSSKVGKKQLHNKKIAPIIIWDFGGQDVFYSTHQTFLTYRAIYMIVLDGSRTLDDPCPSEQYLPGKSEHKTARDYLLFWINTIVTYCKGSVQGFPKIMVVLTHKDQVNACNNGTLVALL
ncbi:probable serine/threonine-protein kinase roco6 [Mytilus trossulus]|uniref:probable serine/threonine-protein kinase roco6 n=1 Tax=Mytilus trossulus TaxID=6551 RepID=UPI0030050790